MNYTNVNNMIFDLSEVSEIDFTQVIETSPSDLFISVDGTKSFVSWEGSTVPSSIEALSTKQGPYNLAELGEIISTTIWTPPPVS
jgi:hypothetical protein